MLHKKVINKISSFYYLGFLIYILHFSLTSQNGKILLIPTCFPKYRMIYISLSSVNGRISKLNITNLSNMFLFYINQVTMLFSTNTAYNNYIFTVKHIRDQVDIFTLNIQRKHQVQIYNYLLINEAMFGSFIELYWGTFLQFQ